MISEKLREAVADYMAEFPFDTHASHISNWTWAGLRNRTKQARLKRRDHTKQCQIIQCLLCEGCRVCGKPPVDSNSRLYRRCWTCYMSYVKACNLRAITEKPPMLTDDELADLLAEFGY